MMLKNNFQYLFVIILLCTSCSINGNFKGLYSYYDSTKAEIPDLLVNIDSSKSICDIENNQFPKVFVINGNQLKKCISVSKKALVYFWEPNCSSKYCLPLNVIAKECNAKNIELFIVADYYDSKQMSLNQNIKNPIFGIDTKYYKTSLTSKYVSRFSNDLMIVKKTKNYDKFFYFEEGKYKDSYQSVYSVDE